MNTILQKIAEKSAEEIADIERSARARSGEAIRLERENADRQCAEILAQGEEDALAIRRTFERMTSLQGRKTILATKREVLDEAFAKAKESLLAQSPETKRARMEKLIDKSGMTGTVTVLVSDKQIYSDRWIKSLSNESARFCPGEETLTEEGVRLITDRAEEDLTLSALLAEARQRAESEIARTLFD